MILKLLKAHFKKTLLEYYPDVEIDAFFNLLSERILNMKRIDISQNLYAVVSGKKCEKFQKALDELKMYKPIQYIIGDTEFHGLVHKVNPSVLIPRPETEELVSWIIKECKEKQNLTILDVGTGSGCIAISLAHYLKNASVFALDVSEKALKVAKKNASNLNIELEFIEANILDWELPKIQFDIIVSNPPYVRKSEKKSMSPNVLNHEPHLALFVEDDDALLFYRQIIKISQKIMKSEGFLFFEINEKLGSDIKQLLLDFNYQSIELRKDVFNKPRMIKAKKI